MKLNEDLSLLVMLEKSRMSTDGKVPIFIRLTVEGKRAEISLGQKVEYKMWNQPGGCVKGFSQEARLINNAIDVAKISLRRYYDASKLENDFVSAQMVKADYNGKKEKVKGLLKIMDLAIDKIRLKVGKGNRAPATLTKWNTTIDKTALFIKHFYGGSDLPLDKLTVSFAEDFVDYLLTENGINTNTAHKYLKNIRGVVADAIARGLVNPQSFNHLPMFLYRTGKGYTG